MSRVLYSGSVSLNNTLCRVQEDIQDFLARTRILGGDRGIFITTDDRGRPSGDAYVEVETCDDLEQALKMHKRDMGSRLVVGMEGVEEGGGGGCGDGVGPPVWWGGG